MDADIEPLMDANGRKEEGMWGEGRGMRGERGITAEGGCGHKFGVVRWKLWRYN